MRHKEKIWTTVSMSLYDKLADFKKEKGFSTVTKAMLWILKNHKGTEEDYFYNSKNAKTLMMTVPDKDLYKEIITNSREMRMSVSKYVRNVLNSFFSRQQWQQ